MKAATISKHVLALLLIGLLAVGVLSGCGSASESQSEDEQTQTTAEDVQEAEEILPELADSWYKIDKLFGVDTWTVSFIGEVNNTDPNHYWTYVPVQATLFDQDGNELQTASESVEVLEPGKSWAVVGVANCETEPASVEITLDTSSLTAKTEAPEEYIPAEDFEVSGVTIGEKEYAGGVGSLTYQVKNLSDKTVNRAKFVILFQKDGKIIGGSSDYAAHDLAPGATSDEDTLVPLVDYDEYVVYLNGDEAPAAQ